MGTQSNDEDAFALIEDLKKRIEELEWLTKDIANGQGIDRQTIAELRLYFDSKDWKRKNFDVLAVQLMKEVLNRTRGLDYKIVMNIFNFGSREEAYRLMEKTVKKFPRDVMIKHTYRSSRKRRLITRVGAST